MKIDFALAAFLLVVCAPARASCDSTPGTYVVVNVHFGDTIGGLAVRADLSGGSRIGVIPSDGLGVRVGTCQLTGWCKVNYECLTGWAMAARYLAPQSSMLRKVVGVSPDDPDGLNVRTGPGTRYPISAHIPYNARGIVVHSCEPSASETAGWCLVSYTFSGWVSERLLTTDLQDTPAPPAATRTDQSRSPPNPPPAAPPPQAPSLSLQTCRLYPSLCAK